MQRSLWFPRLLTRSEARYNLLSPPEAVYTPVQNFFLSLERGARGFSGRSLCVDPDE